MNKWKPSIFLTHEGKTLSARQWSNITGLKYATILLRRKLGWSDEDCLKTPLRTKYEGTEKCSYDPRCQEEVRLKGMCFKHYARTVRAANPQHQKEVRAARLTIPEKYLNDYCKRIQYKCRHENIPCNIDVSDIVVPDTCPILGIPIFRAKGNLCNNSITLDRIIPELGYVKGNVRVISCRANKLKSNMTLAEMWKLYEATKQAILENGLQAYAGFDMTAL